MHCNCNQPTCHSCARRTSLAVDGTQVYYKFNNLRHHRISCGENHDSILEKSFRYLDLLKTKIEELEEKIKQLENKQ